MAFKTFYCVLLLFCALFTMTKGSCLEYGHSCLGGHGKRSANALSHQADMKPATEVDFVDINAIREIPFDSAEDHMKTLNQKFVGRRDEDETMDEIAPKVLKLRKMFLKHFNQSGKHRMHEEEEAAARRTQNVVDSMVDNRWRHLPIWNRRRYQINGESWLNNLEREQQQQQRLSDDNEEY